MRVVLSMRLPGRSGPDTATAPTFRELVDAAVLAESLGFDGYGAADCQDRPVLSTLWPRTLEAIAARTSRIRIFTTVLGVWLTDPARARTGYPALDRLELILAHASSQDIRSRTAHLAFRQEWGAQIWHRCDLRRSTVDLAARYGDPILLSDSTAPYAGIRDWYRGRLAHHGHDSAAGPVAAAGAEYYGTRRSQDAFKLYRPLFEARQRRLGRPVSLEYAVRRGSVLLGSPQQIIDTVLGLRSRIDHQVMHLHAAGDGLTTAQHRASLELFAAEVTPMLARPRFVRAATYR